MEGYILKKADFKTNGHNLSQIGWGGEVFSAGAEIGERKVSRASQLKTGGYDCGIKVEDGAELNFQPEFHCVRRERLATENPASTIGQRRGKVRKKTIAFFVAEALDVKELHCLM